MKSKLASSDKQSLGIANKKVKDGDVRRGTALGDSTRTHYEPCAQTEHELQSMRPGDYLITDHYGYECDAPETKNASLLERGNLYRDGYGWTSDMGCNVDADSSARNNRNLTNLRHINQLFERPYKTIPYMGAGSGQGKIVQEDHIKPGFTTGSKKQCNVLAGVSIIPERMQFCMYHNPQETTHIIPEWVWGGDDTRMAMRRENYKQRCGK
jgi:hypothetical protein